MQQMKRESNFVLLSEIFLHHLCNYVFNHSHKILGDEEKKEEENKPTSKPTKKIEMPPTENK